MSQKQELTESALLVHDCLAAVHLLTALQIHLDSRAARLPIDAPTLRRAVHKFTRETLPAAIESLDVAATHGTPRAARKDSAMTREKTPTVLDDLKATGPEGDRFVYILPDESRRVMLQEDAEKSASPG